MAARSSRGIISGERSTHPTGFFEAAPK